MKCVLALDQGTTSSRSILFDHEGHIRASAQQEFKQLYPQPGWVEHDPVEIWKTQQHTVKKAMHHAGVHCENIQAIGITNQRETTVIWDRKTGEPVYNAVVWQDRRTTEFCKKLKSDGTESLFFEKTGLLLDPYFSGTKIRWILDHVDGIRARAKRGELAFGTIDTWLMWNLTKGALHITDVTNASRTLLFNIHTLKWDDELLALLDIPKSLLPEVRSSSEVYGTVDKFLCECGCPIAGIAGDQHAALFGQACFTPGSSKNTYGTGCFMLMNTGSEAAVSKNKLLTTVAWQRGDEVQYALEGSVFIGGAVVQWLRDELGLIESSSDIQKLAAQVPDTGGVYLVPAFAGLGTSHWDPSARGILIGLTRGTGKAHIARAAQEAICFQSLELVRAMENDAGHPIPALNVDGGASSDNLLMQIQADLLQVPVERPERIETTAFGVAALAGLAVGFWESPNELSSIRKIDRIFAPSISKDEAEARFTKWKQAVERCRDWAE
ncbi:glycerol kinase GlpK [Pontiellaceae bacterium B12219]|nr:glycerol kinase GlpK [Pontiellaceae bacterium B12219]